MPDLPPFSAADPLSAWPSCTIEAACTCGRSAQHPVPLLIEHHGDQAIGALATRLRCTCGARPARVWLVAGRHRSCVGGPPAD